MQIVVTKNDFKFFADCTVAIDPTAAEVAEIAIQTAELARYFEVDPAGRPAQLLDLRLGRRPEPGQDAGGGPAHPRSGAPTWRWTARCRPRPPSTPTCARDEFPFSLLREDANVFVFPSLDAANLSYQLLERLGGAETIGPVLLGMKRPVNILPTGGSVQQIVNLAALTALRAQGEEFVF